MQQDWGPAAWATLSGKISRCGGALLKTPCRGPIVVLGLRPTAEFFRRVIHHTDSGGACSSKRCAFHPSNTLRNSLCQRQCWHHHGRSPVDATMSGGCGPVHAAAHVRHQPVEPERCTWQNWQWRQRARGLHSTLRVAMLTRPRGRITRTSSRCRLSRFGRSRARSRLRTARPGSMACRRLCRLAHGIAGERRSAARDSSAQWVAHHCPSRGARLDAAAAAGGCTDPLRPGSRCGPRLLASIVRFAALGARGAARLAANTSRHLFKSARPWRRL